MPDKCGTNSSTTKGIEGLADLGEKPGSRASTRVHATACMPSDCAIRAIEDVSEKLILKAVFKTH